MLKLFTRNTKQVDSDRFTRTDGFLADLEFAILETLHAAGLIEKEPKRIMRVDQGGALRQRKVKVQANVTDLKSEIAYLRLAMQSIRQRHYALVDALGYDWKGEHIEAGRYSKRSDNDTCGNAEKREKRLSDMHIPCHLTGCVYNVENIPNMTVCDHPGPRFTKQKGLCGKMVCAVFSPR